MERCLGLRSQDLAQIDALNLNLLPKNNQYLQGSPDTGQSNYKLRKVASLNTSYIHYSLND